MMNMQKSYVIHNKKYDAYYYDSFTLIYKIPFQIRHREDGPALIYKRGTKIVKCEWYFHGKKIPVNTQDEFERYLKLKTFW